MISSRQKVLGATSGLTSISHQAIEYMDISTDGMPETERLHRWTCFWCHNLASCQIEILPTRNIVVNGTGAANKNWCIFEITQPAFRLICNQEKMEESSAQSVLLCFVLDGTLTLKLEDRLVELSAKQCVLWATDHSFILNSNEQNRLLIFRLPRILMDRPDLRHASGRFLPLDVAASRIMFEFALNIAEHVKYLDEEVLTKLIRQLGNLAETAFEQLTFDAADTMNPSHKTATLQRLKRYVDYKLSDVELTSSRVARRFKLSKRYINKLFEEENTTLTRYMWRRRLEKAAEQLSDSNFDNETISQIADGMGFKNVSHFSRLFKVTFGATPTQFRQHRGKEPEEN